jgi:hypothetical protein
MPSFNPTSSPTVTCNLSPEGRVALIEIFLRIVSNPEDLDTPGSPQNLAQTWIIELDPLSLCPQAENLIQRYVMAVFYYSTRGGRWSQCSAPTEFDNQEAIDSANEACDILAAGGSGSDAWLTHSECDWGGVACTSTDQLQVNRIDIGKKQPENDDKNIILEILCLANFCASSLYLFS